MALSITCSRVVQRGGKVHVVWSDGSANEFPSLQTAKDFCQPLKDDADLLKRLFVATYLLRDPNVTDVTQIEGHTMTLDLLAANLLQLLRIT